MSVKNGSAPAAKTRERRAYWCAHKECTPPVRVFLLPDEPIPSCGRHGRLVPQRNKPYRGSRPAA